MGLLTILKKVKEKEKEIRLLILGLDNAGKTTILKKFSGSSNDELKQIEPTLGFNIKSLNYNKRGRDCGEGNNNDDDNEEDSYVLNFWDIGGQKSIRSYWKNYYDTTDGIIYVIDSTDISRLDTVKDELYQLLQEEKLFGCSILILANKSDIITNTSTTTCTSNSPNDSNLQEQEESSSTSSSSNCNSNSLSMSLNDISNKLQLNDPSNIKKYFHNRHWKIQSCSGITGYGLIDGIDWLVNDISSRIYMF